MIIGRIISAEEIEIVLTDYDFKFILETYSCEYEILESYFSIYEYLPKTFIDFILDKYITKTEFKGVKGKEIIYNLEKAKFNSLYGMCVTNTIRDIVEFDNEKGWNEIPLKNEEILKRLENKKKYPFLVFAWGVWITSIARFNLLSNVIKNDKNVIYCDTDSMKVTENFDKKIIDEYNKKVLEKIEKVSKELEIDEKKFSPKDKKGNKRPLGIFEHDAKYFQFITQGAKKYAYIDSKDEKIHITVAGVPKKGRTNLKSLNDFRDNFVFDFKYTGKNSLIYNDEMIEFNLKDYKGNTEKINEKYGCVLIPTTYTLNKSEDYVNMLTENSSRRAVFKYE